MSFKPFVLGLAVAAVFAAAPASVSAQIYSWRDQSGTLVLSSTKPAGAASVQTFAVEGATRGFRATRPASRKSKPFEHIIEDHSARQGISADLVRAVIQAESAFNPMARSVKGAMGLMQLMPATAAELGVANPYDAEDNIAGGVAYLRSLLNRYDGNEELALAAYNAGPGAVEKYGAVPPYRETRDYVAKIRGTATSGTKPPSPARVYKTVEIVNGREVARYSNTPSPDASVVRGAEVR
jgi:soluble lytic murein transglycosylase-like protein